MRELENIKASFGYAANSSPDAYFIGLYNGFETALAHLQSREPRLKTNPLVVIIEDEINKAVEEINATNSL